MEPDAGVDDLTYKVDLRSTLLTLGSRSKLRLLSLNRRFLANEDAAFGVCGGVARMDSDALPFAVELRATKQDGKPYTEALRLQPLGKPPQCFSWLSTLSGKRQPFQ